MDLGTLLRTARERRQISLEALARTTRISLAFLDAIERDDFDALPPPIFARGFLRAYAREVGLDPEDVVAQYRQLTERARAEDAARDAARRENAERAAAIDTEGVGLDAFRPLPLTVAALALALVVYIATTRETPNPELPDPAASAVPAKLPPPPAFAPRAPAVTPAVQERPVATTGSALRIEIRASGECWVEARADGIRVLFRLLEDGDRQTIDVQQEFILLVGDPAAFAFSIDGAPGRAVGRPRQPETVRITRDNYRDWLAIP